VDDYVRNGQVLSGNSPFTAAAWISLATSTTWRTIVGEGCNPGLTFTVSYGNLYYGKNCGGTDPFFYSAGQVPLNQWLYVVWTWDGTLNKIYQNGVLVASASNLNNVPYTHAALSIGSYHQTGAEFFNGLIDEVRIYNRALSAAEISAIYNATK
jgi:hypothetical protein